MDADAQRVRITGLSVQARDKNRVNVKVDGTYSFSLDILQVAELGVKVGAEYTLDELEELKDESQYGKLYTRALEYMLVRPRSERELKDYLYRKTRPTRSKTGELRPGVSASLTDRVHARLMEKGYIDDEKFARFWAENRNVRKGASKRKLESELRAKGVDVAVITTVLNASDRSDADELQKIIQKKAGRYPDEQKLIAYLARQGFSYDDIRHALEGADD
ncbi:RecX family transcriptional regulator [Candidatus Saccharibacteria bacterium]|nr:RecX family transcriptional regulator [Candidatus Saccharibacteria bacterium]